MKSAAIKTIAAQSGASRDTLSPLTLTNVAVLQRFIAAWTAKDLNALMDCVSDDFVYRASLGSEPGTTYAGRERVREGVIEMWSADVGSVAEITSMKVIENWGCIEWVYRTTLLGDEVRSEIGCDVLEFEAGRLRSKNAFRKVRSSPICDPRPVTSFARLRTATSDTHVRYASLADVNALLSLMKQLAVFEDYADQFKVTERDLLERGLAPISSGRMSAQFTAIVVERDAIEGPTLLGYAVVYEIPFAFDLRPTIVLKELFVAQGSRCNGLGGALMQAALDHALARKCGRLKWDVLPNNEPAKAFYRRWGGQPVNDWESWHLAL